MVICMPTRRPWGAWKEIKQSSSRSWGVWNGSSIQRKNITVLAAPQWVYHLMCSLSHTVALLIGFTCECLFRTAKPSTMDIVPLFSLCQLPCALQRSLCRSPPLYTTFVLGLEALNQDRISVAQWSRGQVEHWSQVNGKKAIVRCLWYVQ